MYKYMRICMEKKLNTYPVVMTNSVTILSIL